MNGEEDQIEIGNEVMGRRGVRMEEKGRGV